MHELSIAQSIINSVIEEKEKKKYADIATIGLRIGALSGIMPDALLFGFDALKEDTVLAGATLDIVKVPIEAVCTACNTTFEVLQLHFRCPTCNSEKTRLLRGQEIEIAYLDLDGDCHDEKS